MTTLSTLTKENKVQEIADLLISFIGHKVTFFKTSDFGFPQLVHCKITDIKIGSWAQYNNVITVYFIPKGKRNVRGFRIMSYTDFLFYAGHVSLNADMWVKETVTASGMTVRQSDMAFSQSYFHRALASSQETPLIKVLK